MEVLLDAEVGERQIEDRATDALLRLSRADEALLFDRADRDLVEALGLLLPVARDERDRGT